MWLSFSECFKVYEFEFIQFLLIIYLFVYLLIFVESILKLNNFLKTFFLLIFICIKYQKYIQRHCVVSFRVSWVKVKFLSLLWIQYIILTLKPRSEWSFEQVNFYQFSKYTRSREGRSNHGANVVSGEEEMAIPRICKCVFKTYLFVSFLSAS